MDGDVLVLVLSFLAPSQLAPAKAVSRAWRAAAAAALPAGFRRHWQLAGLSSAAGAPRRAGFLEAAALQSFVRVHKVVRTDSFLSLAVRYGVHPTAIKRVNNMISDHSLHSRLEVYVPVASEADLAGKYVQVRYCQVAKRDVAVVLDERDAAAAAAEAEAGAAQREEEARAQAEKLREKLGQLLGRSLRVDRETALFYVDAAGGDVKAAVAEAERDAAWEEASPGPMRTAALRRWIEGEASF